CKVCWYLNLPLGRIPLRQGRRIEPKTLLDSNAPRLGLMFRVRYSRVLVYLAEEILAIDELKVASPQRHKRQAENLERASCEVSYGSYHIRVIQTGPIHETLVDS